MIPGQAQQFFEAAAAQAGGGDFQIERSLRFNAADTPSLNRTPSSQSNTKTWTYSCWVKRYNPDAGSLAFILNAGTSTYFQIYFSADGFYVQDPSFYVQLSRKFRDVSAWYHIVVTVDTPQAADSDRLKIYVNGELQTDFAVDQRSSFTQNTSTAINSTNEHKIGAQTGGSQHTNVYLAEAQLVDGTALTASDFGEYDDNNVLQPKAYSGSYGTNGFYLKFADNSSNAALGTDSSGNNHTFTVNNLNVGAITYSADANYTTDGAYLLDKTVPFDGSTPNSVINESTGAITNSNSRGVWANTARTYIRWDAPSPIPITSGVDFYGGAYNDAAEVATLEIYYTDGTSTSGTFTSSTSSYMGRVTGVTSGKSLDYVKVSCDNACFTAIRVNGSFLDDLPASVNDSLLDTPTDYEAGSGNNGGNYCTLNPLTKTVATVSDGNLFYEPHGSTQHCVGSTMAVSSGKWYWEYKIESTGTYHYAGIADVGTNYAVNWCGSNSGWSVSVNTGGDIAWNNTEAHGNIGTSPASGQIWGWALDMDAGTLKVYINGSVQYSGNSIIPSSTSLPNRTITPSVGHSAHKNLTFNFGQRPFAYTPPTGYVSLCTKNLDDPTIADGSTAFDVNAYSGNGSSQSLSLSFEPDMIWTKGRNNTEWNVLVDQLRPTSKFLYSNATNTESGDQTQGVTAFSSTGYTVGSSDYLNKNTYTYVGWAWDAGTSTSSNTDGSITSNVRANQSAGFSIVTYSGTGSNATVGHGLNAKPAFYVCKGRDYADQWMSYHTSLGATQFLEFNTNGASTGSNRWNDTEPTTSVFSLGTEQAVNKSGYTFLAYCWAAVAGYSDFGLYTGNGSSDGTFVYTGFRPAFVLTKRTDTSENWEIRDSTRNPHNRTNLTLFPHSSSAEDTGNVDFDFLSNGFKLRNTNGSTNANGGTYIYAAFAEHPFKTARAR